MTTLIDTIYEKLQEEIISGKLLPGERLHISQLAAKYQVGLSPIREALSRLLATELVVSISQKGFRVAATSPIDLNDIYKTRAHIEALALRLSIENGNDEWEANIISTYHRLAKFEVDHEMTNFADYQEWENRHRAFNVALVNACGLAHLLRIQSQLYKLTERYRRQWLLMGTKLANGIPYAKGQKKIMEAALRRDTELAIKLLYKHYQEAVKAIEAYFRENNLFRDLS